MRTSPLPQRTAAREPIGEIVGWALPTTTNTGGFHEHRTDRRTQVRRLQIEIKIHPPSIPRAQTSNLPPQTRRQPPQLQKIHRPQISPGKKKSFPKLPQT